MNCEVFFFPVGQGLFAAGTLRRDTNEQAEIVWVYDCGSSSGRKLLEKATNQLDQVAGGKINLLVLSHFDIDHISGIVALIKTFSVHTLMLPLVPLAERLIIAFSEKIGEDHELISFFINPTSYLYQLSKNPELRILYVPASATPVQSTPERISDDLRLLIPQTMTVPDELPAGPATQFLPEDGVITVNGWWEFVPYNDSSIGQAPEAFRSEVKNRFPGLIGKDPTERREALRQLKSSFDRTCGDRRIRNASSLFMYCGPTAPDNVFKYIEAYSFRSLPNCSVLNQSRTVIHAKMAGILYTGDAYLDDSQRIASLRQRLGDARMNRLCVLQVMHHGAKDNWHAGCAKDLNPRFSVFCSDPERSDWRHPHAEVLRDFWLFFPQQVDKETGFGLSFRIPVTQ